LAPTCDDIAIADARSYFRLLTGKGVIGREGRRCSLAPTIQPYQAKVSVGTAVDEARARRDFLDVDIESG